MKRHTFTYLAILAALLLASPAWASWAHVGARGHVESKTAGTTIDQAVIGAVTAGNILIVQCESNNPDGTNGPTTHFSVSDTHGNSYVRAVEEQVSAGSAADGIVIGLFVSDITTGISNGENVTCTIDTSTAARGIYVEEYSVAAGKTYSIAGVNGATGTGTALSVTLSGLTSAEYSWFGDASWEGVVADFSAGDADYLNRNGAGCTSGGAAASNICQRDSDRLNFTGTSDTFTHTLGTSRDWSIVLAALQEVDEGAPPPCPKTLLLLGVGC